MQDKNVNGGAAPEPTPVNLVAGEPASAPAAEPPEVVGSPTDAETVAASEPLLADLFWKDRLRFWLAFAILLWPLGPLLLPPYVLIRWLRGIRDEGGLMRTISDPVWLWATHPFYVARLAWRRENPRLVLAVILLLPLLLTTVWGIYVAGEGDPIGPGGASQLLKAPFEHPPMGTDGSGRGLFGLIADGAFHSYFVGLLAVIVAMTVGLVCGRATERRRLDGPLMIIVQVLETIPLLVLLMVVLAMFSDWSENLTAGRRNQLRVILLGIALGVGLAPPAVRLIRDKIRSFKSEEFVTAAKAHGISQQRIIWRHIILTNGLSDLVIVAAQTFGAAILMDVSLSYVFSIANLKQGGEPYPSWAWLLLTPESKNALIGNVSHFLENWWVWFFPSFFTVSTIIGLFLFGDGLRNWGSPRERYNVVEARLRFEAVVARHVRADRSPVSNDVGADPMENSV